MFAVPRCHPLSAGVRSGHLEARRLTRPLTPFCSSPFLYPWRAQTLLKQQLSTSHSLILCRWPRQGPMQRYPGRTGVVRVRGMDIIDTPHCILKHQPPCQRHYSEGLKYKQKHSKVKDTSIKNKKNKLFEVLQTCKRLPASVLVLLCKPHNLDNSKQCLFISTLGSRWLKDRSVSIRCSGEKKKKNRERKCKSPTFSGKHYNKCTYTKLSCYMWNNNHVFIFLTCSITIL